MALDKFATWGKLPPLKPAAPGLAKVVEAGFDRVATQRVSIPSDTAFRLIAVLGQVRDALLDQNKATPKSVNDQLARAKAAQSTVDAHAQLGRLNPALAHDFLEQVRPLDAKNFGQQRRERVAELMDFETKLAQLVQ